MRTMSTPIGDRFDQVIGAEAHASSPTVKGKHGGEWDAWYALPRRTRRRLIGAGFARKGAMEPDVLADLITRQGVTDDYREALDWFYRTAIAALDERQRERRRVRRVPFVDRNAKAIAQGYLSFWQYRKAARSVGEQPGGTTV